MSAPAELAPHARAMLRSHRRTLFVLGGLLLALGTLGVGVLAAAAPLADLLGIGAVLFFVAIAPGLGLIAWGRRPIDRHPLVVALEQRPETIRAVQLSYMARLGGYTRLATITLADGSAHGVELG